MKMKKIAAGCCAAALAMLIMTNSGICSDAMFGQSITDTEDIEIYIDVGAERQEISKYIYGLNLSPDMDGVTVYGTKQRGEAISSYNWETNSANMTAAEDYENSYALVSEYSQKDWSIPALYTSDLVKKAAAHNIGSRYVTLQMMGFVANDSYGAAELGDADRWAAVRFNKGVDLSIQPDLHDGAVYMDEYVSYLVSTYGYAADGGINGYFLDREPEMWDENFAIVRSSPITAEELAVSSATLAASVKKIDPTALVYGPSVNGIESYVNLCNQKDWDNHSREYSWFIDFYLDRMHTASEAAGTRLLDVLDLHFISDAKSVVLEPIIGSSSTFANEERVRWSGLSDIPWVDVTSFETYNYSKPNVKYFQQICEKYNLNPAECMMVGDSLVKDYPATELGMDFYLLLNEDSPEAEQAFTGRKGDRKAFLKFVQSL